MPIQRAGSSGVPSVRSKARVSNAESGKVGANSLSSGTEAGREAMAAGRCQTSPCLLASTAASARLDTFSFL